MILLRVLGFSLLLTLFFTLVANLLPQVEGDAPKATKVDLSSLTPEKYAAIGDTIFHGKGTCTLCHNERGRAPNIAVLNLADETKKALADANYQGNATDIESYIHESMLKPSAYVVPGFGKKGAPNVSPMPTISKPPIALSAIEINAVIAYLQAKDGNDITVPLPSADAAPAVADNSGGSGDAPAIAATAEEALNKYGCTACHTILDSEADTGPNLKKVGPTLSEEFIRKSIIYPNADITKGYEADIMPDDFAEQMNVKELEMIVKFIRAGGKK
ncbi:MAG TPA: c-type cytochrome [Gammaproteobacteria bacterium]|nr:c-type cytochrome [Gammaproteobacteria bacterium]